MNSERILKKSSIRKKSKEAAGDINSANTLFTKYGKELEKSSAIIAREKSSFGKRELDARLPELSISELSKYRKGIPVAELERAGYRTVDQLTGMPVSKLTAYRGIGKVKARTTVAALEQIRLDIVSRTSMPVYDELQKHHHGFLKALYNKKILSDIPWNESDISDDLQYLKKQLRKVRKESAWYKFLFFGRRAQSKATAELMPLAEEVRQFHGKHRIGEARRALKIAEASQTFQELKELYLQHIAEYASFFYSDSAGDKSQHSPVSPVQRLGMPSAELAEEIDSIVLNTAGLEITLRGYQEFGIKYLVHQRRTVLGDEMGLGKTIQALGAFVHLHNTQSASHCLVVAPAGLLPNWVKEVSTRTRFQVWKLHGPDRATTLLKWINNGGIAIISYASLRNTRLPTDLRPDMVIGDEAHYVKNPTAIRTKAFSDVANMSGYVSLLSGTPMENKPEEFVSVMASLGADEHTGSAINEKPRQELSRGAANFAKAVAPIYLRRNQSDVLHELPDRLELLEWVDQGDDERNCYVAAVQHSHAMAIRQAATTAVEQSAKIERLTELLEHYSQEERKVVIFSFFHSALDAVCDLLPIHFRIDGQQGTQNRLSVIDEFTSQPGFAVLVSQIDAGGVGLNIQAASVVILMEPQLKPTTEWQAIARVHRMGQARRVMVHRLLAVDTIDERLHMRLAEKSASFETYARHSEIKESITAATDQNNVRSTNNNVDTVTASQIVAMEKSALNIV